MTAPVASHPGKGLRPTRGTRWAVLLTLLTSLGMILVTSPAAVSPAVYWVVSGLALAGILAVLVIGEHSWERSVDSARAAGLVAR